MSYGKNPFAYSFKQSYPSNGWEVYNAESELARLVRICTCMYIVYICVHVLVNYMYTCIYGCLYTHIMLCAKLGFGPSEDFFAQSVDQGFAQQSEDLHV